MIMGFFTKISGLSKIIAQYPALESPQSRALERQTIQIGAVRFRKCVRVNIDTNGFYFCIHTVFRKYPQVFIPWEEVGSIKESKIYGKRAQQLSIGEPPVGTIRIPQLIFTKMKNYLNDTKRHV
jgi:hypothetical protein